MRLSAASGSMMSYIENTQSFAAERELHPDHVDALRAVRLGIHAQPAEAVYYARLVDVRTSTLGSLDSRTQPPNPASGHRLPHTRLEER
jgi:hypothetical protein